MNSERKTLLLPMLLITVGSGWLLSTLGVAPDIHWIWTLGLATVGALVFAIGGFDKFTVVVGPFFMIASGLSILRQTGRLQIDVELPILVIVGGVLMLVARSSLIPPPQWMLQNARPSDRVPDAP